MNFMKKLFIVTFAFTLPLMSMQNGMDLKKALQVFGFTKGTVTQEQMKRRFFELAKKCHPDQSGGDKNKATQMMQELVNARDALKEAEYPINVEKPMQQARYQSQRHWGNWSKNYSYSYERQQSDEDLFAEAVLGGKIAEVEKLLKKNKNLANSRFRGTSMLFCAISVGNIHIIKLLLEHDADVNEIDGVVGTPLIQVIASSIISNADKILIIKMLLKHGVNLNEGSSSLGMPLQHAIDLNNEEVLKLLLVNGVNVKVKFKPFGDGPLAYAISANCSPQVIELLLKYGVDTNEIDASPLVQVVKSSEISNENKIAILKMLLKHGADLEKQVYSFEGTPLKCAVDKDNETIVRFLLDAGARSFTPGGPVFEKAKPEIYSLFIERFKKQQEHKWELFQQKAYRNLLNVTARMQREKQENMFSKYYRSWTVNYSTQNKSHLITFFMALQSGDIAKITEILHTNPKFANVQRDNLTPLHFIMNPMGLSQEKQIEVLELLLMYGADIDAVCDHQVNWNQDMKKEINMTSCLRFAKERYEPWLVKHLLSRGARVDLPCDGSLWKYINSYKSLCDIFEEELCGPLPPQRSKL